VWGISSDWVRGEGLDDIRQNLKPRVNQPGKDVNRTLEEQTRMNIVHEDTSTTPISRRIEKTGWRRMSRGAMIKPTSGC
jgi:hypothetical protein